MTDNTATRTLHDRLEAQEAALAALHADHAALRADHAALLARLTARRRRPASRQPRALAALALALLVALVPLGILAANPFIDIAGSPHATDIDLIYNAGITTGCDPDEYCPTANVTRQEMASFLARTAGLGANPPVVNASTLRGYAPGALLRVAQARGTNVIGDDFAVSSANPAFTELPGAVVSIDAPGNGYVLVSATVSVSTFALTPAIMRIRDITPGAPGTAISPEISRSDQESSTGPLSQTFLFPVTGAGAKTFRIEMARAGAGTNPNARNGVITALFIPFNGSGVAP